YVEPLLHTRTNNQCVMLRQGSRLHSYTTTKGENDMKRLLIAALAVTTLGSTLAAVSVQADEIQSRMIRFGYGLNEDSNQGRGAKVLAEEIAKASDGKLKVRTYGATSLGPDEQMQNALIGGSQEMMVGSTATLVGITKEMAIWDT